MSSPVFELFATLTLDTKGVDEGLSKAEGGLSSFGSKLSGGLATAVSAAGAGLAAASTAVVAFGKSSVDAGMSFDSSMSQVAATMGYTTAELNDSGSDAAKTFQQLRDFAQEMGAKTAFSASESADALNYMALAGYDAETSMKMLPTVLDLAAAGGLGLASASDMVTDAQSALGLSLDETSAMVDQMAVASSKSNTSVGQLGEAFLTIGATARNVKGGTAELSTVLGVLADNGIKGSEGGTHLRNMLLSLQNPTDKGAAALDALGVSVYDADGNMRSLIDIVSDMQVGLGDMDQASRDTMLSGIFNKTDLAAANALLGTSRGRFDELTAAITDSTGAAQDMANVQLDNLAGDVTIFQSALEGAKIALSDQVTPTLRSFVQEATNGLSSVTTAFKEEGITGAMRAFSEFLSNMISLILQTLPDVIQAGTQLLLALVQGIIDNLPQVGTAAIEIISNLASGLSNALPQLIPAAVNAILTLVQTFMENRSKLVESALNLIQALAEGIINAVPIIIEKAPIIISEFIDSLMETIPKIIDAGIKLFSALVENLPTIIANIVSAVVKIVSAIAEKIGGAIPEIASKGFELFMGLIQKIPEVITGIGAKVGELLKSIFDKIKGGVKDMVQAGKDLLDGLRQGIQDKINSVVEKIKNLGKSILDAIKGFFGIHSPSTVFSDIGKNMIDGLVKGIGEAWKGVTEFFTKAIKAIPEFFKNLPENVMKIGSNVIGKLKEGASSAWNTAKNKFTEISTGIANAFKDAPSKLLTKGRDMIDKLKSGISEKWPSAKTKITEIATSIPKGFDKAKDNLLTVGKNITTGLSNGFSQGYGNVRNALNTVKANISTWITGVNNVKDSLVTVGKNLMIGLQNGLVQAANNALDAAKKAASNVVSVVKGVFGVHSPSKVFEEIGEELMEGLVVGIDNNGDTVTRAIEDIADENDKAWEVGEKIFSMLLGGVDKGSAALNDSLDGAHEYVKKFMDAVHVLSEHMKTIGNNLMVSMANGIIEGTKRVTEALQNSIDTVTKFASSVSSSEKSSSKKTSQDTISGSTSGTIISTGKAITGVAKNISDSADTIVEAFEDVQTASESVFGITSGSTSGTIISTGKAIVGTMKSTAKSTSDIIEAFEDVQTASEDMLDVVEEYAGDVQTAYDNIAPNMVTAGNNIMNGLSNGIVQAANSTINTAVNTASSLVKSVKVTFGINSPSTVFADIGKNMMQGLSNGIENNIGIVSSAMEELDDIIDGASDDLDFDDTYRIETRTSNDGQQTAARDQQLYSLLNSILDAILNVDLTMDGQSVSNKIYGYMDYDLGMLAKHRGREAFT